MSGTSTITAGGLTLNNFFKSATYSFAAGADESAFIANYTGASFGVDAPATASPTNTIGAAPVWNWSAATDAKGVTLGGAAGGGIVNSTGSTGTGDSWTLRVQLGNPAALFGANGSGTSPGEQILVNGQRVDASGNVIGGPTGTGPGSETFSGGVFSNPAVTFTGTGAVNLANLFHSLSVNFDLGAPDSVSVDFVLTDTTSSSAIQFVEFVSTPCYAAGTRIATPSGEVDVARLAIGDTVMTATGVARAIKWIGRRGYTADVVAANAQLQPVTIRRDAIAPGMPHRDLTVSPMHALYIDDAFVPAASLVNGVSILRHDELAAVAYIHIELDQHDVVFAEGLPAETFIDDNSRLMFDNADEFYALYGADRAVVAFSAPRIEEGVQLETIRRRIAARAGQTLGANGGALRGNVERIEDGVLIGWATDAGTVELDVFADGEFVGRTVANRYRADLDHAGINGGRGGFSIALPAAVTRLAQVSVRRAGDAARVGGVVETATV